MNLLKRSYLINLIQALILFSFSVSGLTHGGWLEVVLPNHPAPSLVLQDLKGNQVKISDLKGKTVLLNFWTTWCPPCIEEMPSLIRLKEAMNQSDFVILAINVEESERRVSKMAARLKLTFPVLLDPSRVAANAWEVKVFPSSFLVDGQGRLRYKAIGPIEWDSDEATSIVHQVMQK
ncbi:TlpA family protein disulfide reductase [Candidatus Thiodiazotropha sp. LNASS1]|uniref:TlpA family protein disulfide reductase n=1 Tax=Candidatus Thiodiazotropha sp. LNASS1 TaxID=3096260 RepID=UPI0034773EF5